MHLTTLVNILSKLRYFEGRNDMQIDLQELFRTFVFPRDLWKVGTSWISRKRGILEKVGHDPLTSYAQKCRHYDSRDTLLVWQSWSKCFWRSVNQDVISNIDDMFWYVCWLSLKLRFRFFLCITVTTKKIVCCNAHRIQMPFKTRDHYWHFNNIKLDTLIYWNIN